MRLLVRLVLVSLLALPVSVTAQMGMSGVLGIPMDRGASGTTWIPDAVLYPSRHTMLGAWDLMTRGIAFGQFDSQGGPRGDRQFGTLNWGMLMASHSLAGGQIQLRSMLSLDAAGVTKSGYPLLLQSGERLHDRQHPHDFWMELGAAYDHPISAGLGVQAYAAAAGEPALGPVAFTDRPSSMDNPMAPLGHHWQDATHISFGVATAGVYSTRWKLEGSAFNGREPDDQRWDFGFGRMDSYSARMTVNPNSRWSATAGYGFIRDAEGDGRSLHRVVASIMRGVAVGDDGQLTSTLIFGANTRDTASGLSHSVLAESEWVIDSRNTVFARVESAQKSVEDLQLTLQLPLLSPSALLNVRSASVGYVRELARVGGATIGLGASGAVNFVPDALRDLYGSAHPVGGMIFLRIRTARNAMAGMPGM